MEVIEREPENIDVDWKGKWRNLLFHRNGKTYLGGGVYDTAGEATANYFRIKNLPIKKVNGWTGHPVFTTKCGRRIRTARIVAHIPVPVKED